jgi:hypothetical protein
MGNFKIFLEQSESEEQKNVEKLLSGLPVGHRRLLHKYKFTYTPNNTLEKDSEHIGYIHNKKVVVAAPWNYSRKFTTLHEIAHLVFEKLINKKMKKEWSSIVKNTKGKKQKQNDEELFCHAYACHYSGDHCPRIHDHPEWTSYMKKLK